jgi:hypothetical protein
MSGKTGLLVGLMIGLVIAASGAVATMFITGGAIKERESTAWQAGYDTRAEHALGEQRTITTTLNQGLVNENEKLSAQNDNARAKLAELLARTDLSAEARDKAAQAAKELGDNWETLAPAPAPAAKPYDDTLGKLDAPEAAWKVTHILVSWTGAFQGLDPKQPRTKEEARRLVDDIWAKYSADPTDDNWRAMQLQYNEDSAPHNVYDSKMNLIEPFKQVSRTTKKGFARIVESQFGFHLIRREG